MALLTVEEARGRILAEAGMRVDLKASLPLLQAVGSVVAEDIVAPLFVPPCDNSAMDGYAVCAKDVVPGQRLPVSGVIYAGDAPTVLQPGTAVRIFTGAPLPSGADAVVIQEDVQCSEQDMLVSAGVSVRAGDNIRRRGEDIQQGERLFARGHRLRAVDVGLLASVGISQVAVFSPLRVGLLCTGDELLEPGEVAAPGKIFNSNRYLLAAMLRELHCEVIDAGRVKDDLSAIEQALRDLALRCDVIISTGGVSVGDADFVKQAVQAVGKLDVWKIAVKPGKPLAFGSVSGKPFFGLPGNPVSAFVTFQLFVRPFLHRAQGGSINNLRCLFAQAGFAWPKSGKREEYLRVTLRQQENVLIADLLPHQGSGVLSSVVQADALLRVPVGVTFAEGECVECLLL